MKIGKILGAATLTSALLFGSAFAGDQDVVVKMKDKNITLSDVDRIASYKGVWMKEIKDPKEKAAVVSRVVTAKVIADIARAKGFDKRPDVAEELEMQGNGLLAAEFLRNEVIDKVEVTDADVKKYYDEHPESFRVPEMIKARHILISMTVPGKTPEETVQKANERAAEALKRIRAGEDFAKVASEVSDDVPTKANGGDLGFFGKGKMVKEFEDVAFSLKKGQVSEVVKTVFGLHIIKVDDRVEEKIQPFENVKNQLTPRVLYEAQQKAVEQFRAKALKDAGVEINLQPLGIQPEVPRH